MRNAKNPLFVIHKHHAKKLHWDFRLEMGSALRSWAVPKEPPLGSGVKRLAIQVEDHDLSYADFEGEIPQGQYGAGKVEIWDKGTYEMESMKGGKLVFKLNGKKLNGKYVLLRFKKAGEKDWLFFKKE